jgi:hypothetical protein
MPGRRRPCDVVPELFVRRCASFVLACAALFWTARALAATVLIVRPVNSTQAMEETVVRIRGELLSAGFAVEMVDSAEANSRDQLEKLAAQRGADAALGIVGNTAPNSVEAWVVDRLTGKSVMRRLPYEPQSDRAPQTLAIRAIELLRSSFLEMNLMPEERARAEVPPEVERLVGVDVTPRRRELFGIEVGAAGILGGGGVGPVIVPVLAFNLALGQHFLMQATLAGLGTRPSVTTKEGSAQVAQQLALFGFSYRFRQGGRWQPFVGLAAGALYTSAKGSAEYPKRGLSAHQWSLLMDAGAGCRLRLRDRFFLALAGHLQVAQPYPSLRFLDSDVASSGRPNVLLALTAGAWL